MQVKNIKKNWVSEVTDIDCGDLTSTERENVINKMLTEETMYAHEWELGDLVLYDNWSTIHYRDKFEGKRRLKRVTWDQNWYNKRLG